MDNTEAIERSCKYLNQLFSHTIENMKSGFNIWKDFTYKATKLHLALKTICQAVSGFLESFQKMADLATNAKGATKEIGVALTRLCLRHRNIEKKLDHVTHTFEASLIGPIEDKLEEWKKLVFQIEKEHARDSKKAIRDYKKVSLQAEKIEKKNKKDANLQKELTSLLLEKKEKLVAMEGIEKSSVRSALLEERKRHCHMVLAMKPFVDAEMALLSDLMHLEEIMSSLTRQAQDPNVLPSSSEQVILDITSQTIPEGWSCQSTRSFPTPSDSLLSLSSVYSTSNRSSIVSDFEAQSAIADGNLNASLSSLPASLLRNPRAGGSVPPPVDRSGRNGRPLYRQSLYNPSLVAGSQSSSTSASTGITYLQQHQLQHQQQRHRNPENVSRIFYPSTSAPTTPEVKLQPNDPLTSCGQQRVVGKPPTFPPSYLRRKGSFGRALHPTQSNSSYSPSPASSALPPVQPAWADSERPRSLALSGSGQTQFAHSFPEQMGCSLAPPSSQNPSLSSSSTLKDEDDTEDESQNTLRLATQRLHRINPCSSVDQAPESATQSPPPSSTPETQTVATFNSVPANAPSPSRSVNNSNNNNNNNNNNSNASRDASSELATGGLQKVAEFTGSCNGRAEYSTPHVLSPRRSLPSGLIQRPPSAVPPQRIIDGYKIHSEVSGKSTPSPKSVNYVDFHLLQNQGIGRGAKAPSQDFINLDRNQVSQSIVNSGHACGQQAFASPPPPQVHSSVKSHGSASRHDGYQRPHAQQHLAQLESESHAYGMFVGKSVNSAPFDHHFQEKIVTFNPQQQHQRQEPQGRSFNNHRTSSPQVKCSPLGHHQFSPGLHHNVHSSPAKRHLPPPPPPSSSSSFSHEGRPENQYCPWTLRTGGSPVRPGSTTPTNEIDSAQFPPPPPPNEDNARAPTGRPSSHSHHDPALQHQLPKGFVKHWENSV